VDVQSARVDWRRTVPFGTVLTARSSSHVGIATSDVKPKARSRGRIARADDPDVSGGGEVEELGYVVGTRLDGSNAARSKYPQVLQRPRPTLKD
jgi:hypothetical protein